MPALNCLFLIFLIASFGCIGQDLAGLKSATVLSSEGEKTNLVLSPTKISVIITLGTDCPITQKYVPTINRLKEAYANEVEFIGVFPKEFSVAEVNTFIKEYTISIPCVIDHESQVTKLLNAKVTPEAFLISRGHQQVYAGAIDNWFYKLGSYRSKPTQHYLSDAIKASLKGNTINVTRTEAVGCPIAKPASHHGHH